MAHSHVSMIPRILRQEYVASSARTAFAFGLPSSSSKRIGTSRALSTSVNQAQGDSAADTVSEGSTSAPGKESAGEGADALAEGSSESSLLNEEMLGRRHKRTMISSLESLGSTQTRSSSYRPYQNFAKAPDVFEVSVSHLLAAGAHLGHRTSSLQRAQTANLYGTRNGNAIIDVARVTMPALRRAANVVREVCASDGIVLIVGTGQAQRTAVLKATERMKPAGAHVATERWMPGVLTNAPMLLTRAVLSSMRDASSELRGTEPRGRSTGRRDADGVDELHPATLTSRTLQPSLVIVMDPLRNRHALREATLLNIPTIAITDTDVDPRVATYAIPASDDSARTAELILGVLSRAGQDGVMDGQRRRDLAEKRAADANLAELRGRSVPRSYYSAR